MPEPVKVLYITHSMELGGMEQVIATLCRTLDREVFTPAVLCLRDVGPIGEELRAEGIPVDVLPGDPRRANYLAWLHVARRLRVDRPDVVHTHNHSALLLGASGAKLAGVPRIIHTDHARVYPVRPHLAALERFVSRWVDRLVAVSDATAGDLTRHLKVPGGTVTTVLNGIDGRVYQRPSDRGATRRRLGLPDEAFVVGQAARLVPEKGLPHLLRAVARLRPTYPHLHVVLIGHGPEEAMLKALALELHLEDIVHFPGVRRDVPDVLQALDAYVLPSVSEGLPMGLLEAMAASRPIVASDVGGIGTAITNDVSGLLVPPANEDELARALALLMDEPSMGERLGAEAFRAFEAEFSAASMSRRYEALYRPEP